MGLPQGAIKAAGNALLAAVLAELEATEGWTAPSRVGFVPGAVLAFDGDQLTVNWLSLGQSQPGVGQQTAVHPAQVLLFYAFDVTLLRKVKTVTGQGKQGGIPTPEALAVDADTIMDDGTALLDALLAIHAGYTLVPPNVPFKYGDVNSVGPEGGLSGVRVQVAFQAGMSPDGTY